MAFRQSREKPMTYRLMTAVVVLCAVLTGIRLSGLQAAAQNPTQIPPRTTEAVNSLQESAWRQLSPGLEAIEVATALGTRLVGLRIANDGYRFNVVQQEGEKGEKVRSVVRRLDAVLGVNGGFFASSAEGRLSPVGMLIDDGEPQSAAWPQTGGFLAIDDDGAPSITLSSDGAPEGAFEAIQSRPVILEPGGKWAMNTNGNDPEPRTIFCRLDEDTSLILVVAGHGLSLYEAGWLLRSPAWGGFFDCDSAIALDGGSSTQLTIAGEWDLRSDALVGVQNFLVVQRRDSETQ